MDSLGTSISLLVAAPFALIALGFLYFGIRGQRRQGIARRTWLPTQARITFSDVEARRSTDSEGGSSISYYPRVVYEYAVNGNRFQGSRVGLGSEIGRGNYNAVERVVREKYPTGATVQVFYNPNDPREAALELNAAASKVFIWVAVLIIVIVGITMVFTAGGLGFFQQLFDQVRNLVPGN